jgi:hypothetical protein
VKERLRNHGVAEAHWDAWDAALETKTTLEIELEYVRGGSPNGRQG